ncbi:MBL fold metallo-hydrolase [Pseudidiomarina mangrovi]|uniref:MBL fold metallo-hydrolase n=1 Tax=Pseudidiomarina mangrovi TaxID=2487133 RepID=UPI000FCA8F33|nr:MBL fold metallo-hydrolase [Pseudidiomarina mangrovi]
MRWLVVIVVVVSTIWGCTTALPAGKFADRNPYLQMQHANALTFWRMRLFGAEPWADQYQELAQQPQLVPRQAIDQAVLLTPGERPQVTWLGHASFLVQYQGLSVLTDPILSLRASPFSFAGPKRLQPAPLAADELPAVDWVVISHNHYDHLDSATIQALPDNVRYAVPLGLTPWFLAQGVAAEQVYEFDWWDDLRIGPLTLTATPSQHWSARSLWDRNDTLWASWLIQIDDFTAWFAGDTGYNEVQFKQVGGYAGRVDVAMIPIGAYLPRWFMQPQHIDPAEALQMHRDVRAQHSLAMHWGTYPLAAEGLQQTVHDLASARLNAELEPTAVRIIPIGATEQF